MIILKDKKLPLIKLNVQIPIHGCKHTFENSEKTFPNLIMVAYKKPRTNVTLNEDTLKAFPRFETRQGHCSLPLPPLSVTQTLQRFVWKDKEKESKVTMIRRKK